MAPAGGKQVLVAQNKLFISLTCQDKLLLQLPLGVKIVQFSSDVTNLMSSPLRKRIRSPGFSPHSSAGLSGRETSDGRRIKRQSGSENGNWRNVSGEQGAPSRQPKRGEMVTHATPSSVYGAQQRPSADELPVLHKETVLSKQSPWWNLF